jgi:hypothetical protein
MAIYNIFDYYEREKESSQEASKRGFEEAAYKKIQQNFIADPSLSKDRFFSALAARFFFFLLLLADILWGIYSVSIFMIKGGLVCFTLGRVPLIRKSCARSYLNTKRSVVCGLALFIALFSPALGIMFSCMYFLMYDKNGVNEVVPTSLKEQFQDIFPSIASSS